MNPSLFSLLLILSPFSLLHLVSSLCTPRSYPYNQVLSSFLPPPTTTPIVRSVSKPALASSPLPSPINSPPTTTPPSQNPSTSSNVDDFVSDAMNSLQIATVDASVNAICKKTDYPDICASAIQSVSPYLAKADPRTILKLVMKGAMIATRVAMDVANVLVNKPNIDKTTKSILGVCADGFEDAISDLQEAGKALDNNDAGTMNSMLSALFSDYGGCGDAFTDVKMNSPMKAYEELLYKHASNCMAIGQLI